MLKKVGNPTFLDDLKKIIKLCYISSLVFEIAFLNFDRDSKYFSSFFIDSVTNNESIIANCDILEAKDSDL